MNIMIDIDGTVVDSFLKWDKFCLKKYNKNWEEIHRLGSLEDSAHTDYVDYLDFWNTEDLYDDLAPLDFAVSTIKILGIKHNIIFVSHCNEFHKTSKLNFIKKHFSDIQYKFIDTTHKELIRADVIIDDYGVYLEKCKNVGMDVIQFKNNYNAKKYNKYFDWREINEYFNVNIKALKC